MENIPGINFRTLQFHTGKTIHTTVKQPNRQGSHSTQNNSKFWETNDEKLDENDAGDSTLCTGD